MTHHLNAAYSTRRMKSRYEVWFLRCGLADGGGAWWFRYLLTNLGRKGCDASPSGMPIQVWATWFPRHGKPQTFIQGFPIEALALSAPRKIPFRCHIAENGIEAAAGVTGVMALRPRLLTFLAVRVLLAMRSA